MESREINKLKKQKREICRQDYTSLSDAKREKSWNRLVNIETRLKQLKAK